MNINAKLEPLTSGMSAKLNPLERMRGIKTPVDYSDIWEQLGKKIRSEPSLSKDKPLGGFHVKPDRDSI
jgi:hypothetical protein